MSVAPELGALVLGALLLRPLCALLAALAARAEARRESAQESAAARASPGALRERLLGVLARARGRTARPPWGGAELAVGVVVFAALSLLAGAALERSARGAEPGAARVGLGGLAAAQLALLAGAATVLALVWRKRRPYAGAAGLSSGGGLGAELALGGAAWFLVAPWVYGLEGLSAELLARFGRPVEPQAQLEAILSLSGASLLAGALIAVVLAPCAEELFFRGLIQPWLQSEFGPRLGLAATALGFACIHASLAHLVPLFALALALGALRDRSASLWPAVACHACHNALTLAWASYAAGAGPGGDGAGACLP